MLHRILGSLCACAALVLGACAPGAQQSAPDGSAPGAPAAPKILRIGIMGPLATDPSVEFLLDAIKTCM